MLIYHIVRIKYNFKLFVLRVLVRYKVGHSTERKI